MTKVVRLDGRQVTMPIFDSSLLKAAEEMAPEIVVADIATCTHHMIIKGGVHRHGPDDGRRRMFVAGRIQTKPFLDPKSVI